MSSASDHSPGAGASDLYLTLKPFPSTRPTMLLDAGGTGVGLVMPTSHPTHILDKLHHRLLHLRHLGKTPKDPKRGTFPILQAGSQMGQGSKVSAGLKFCIKMVI